MDECDAVIPRERREQGDGIYVVASMYQGKPKKAQAVYFRISALAEIVEKQQAPGWTLPKTTEGWVPTREELLRAAAVFPLSEVDGDIGFDLEGFLAKALELADVEGNA